MLDPRELFRQMKQQLRASYPTLGLLFGRDERSMFQHYKEGVIPVSAGSYYRRISEVRTYPGYAVIIIDMPANTEIAEYRRYVAENDKRRSVSPHTETA